jgi:CRP/FNR family transcriptional regulator
VGVTTDLPKKLQGISFFQDLSPESLAMVCKRMVRRSAPAGTILFRKGEKARGVYVLLEGRVEIFRSTADGREQVLHSEVPVRSVAELPVFDGGSYPASGRTVEDSVLVFLSTDDFQRLYRGHPEIADAVIKNLGSRLRDLVRVVERTTLKSVQGRVAATLLEVADAQKCRFEGGTFTLHRTQSDIAHELATSRESVARALGEFRRKGIISSSGRSVTVHGLAALERVAMGQDP